MVDIEQVKQWAVSRWKLGEMHGISHWERVERNGLLLATPECDVTVIRLFAYLHDSCRENDMHDRFHGPRAAKMIEGLRKTLLKDLSDHQFKLLQEACRLHTSTHSTGNPTIDACFDADRLDLGRVNITPDTEKMATEKGKELARQLILLHHQQQGLEEGEQRGAGLGLQSVLREHGEQDDAKEDRIQIGAALL